jgi:hypothetical protein
VIFVLWLIWRAPEGQQDREGFHDRSGEKPGARVVGEEGGSEIRKVG